MTAAEPTANGGEEDGSGGDGETVGRPVVSGFFFVSLLHALTFEYSTMLLHTHQLEYHEGSIIKSEPLYLKNGQTKLIPDTVAN